MEQTTGDQADPRVADARLAGALAADMAKVLRALSEAATFFAAQDQADSARGLSEHLRYSPLRTILEHSQETAERVEQYLRDRSRT